MDLEEDKSSLHETTSSVGCSAVLCSYESTPAAAPVRCTNVQQNPISSEVRGASGCVLHEFRWSNNRRSSVVARRHRVADAAPLAQ